MCPGIVEAPANGSELTTKCRDGYLTPATAAPRPPCTTWGARRGAVRQNPVCLLSFKGFWRRKHQRTRLRSFVPCSREKYREIRRLLAQDDRGAPAFESKFNCLRTEFPSR